MRLLLDTHALLWFLRNDRQLSPTALAVVLDPNNERWLSPCSLLEIALKVRLGKLTLHVPFGSLFPAQLKANDIHLLPLEVQHIEMLSPRDVPILPKPSAWIRSGQVLDTLPTT